MTDNELRIEAAKALDWEYVPPLKGKLRVYMPYHYNNNLEQRHASDADLAEALRLKIKEENPKDMQPLEEQSEFVRRCRLYEIELAQLYKADKKKTQTCFSDWIEIDATPLQRIKAALQAMKV